MISFSGWRLRRRERAEPRAHTHPEGENARHPQADIDPVVVVDEEPQPHAGDKAGEGGEQKEVIQFLEHGELRADGLLTSYKVGGGFCPPPVA